MKGKGRELFYSIILPVTEENTERLRLRLLASEPIIDSRAM
jgi:hypothetical protein